MMICWKFTFDGVAKELLFGCYSWHKHKQTQHLLSASSSGFLSTLSLSAPKPHPLVILTWPLPSLVSNSIPNQQVYLLRVRNVDNSFLFSIGLHPQKHSWHSLEWAWQIHELALTLYLLLHCMIPIWKCCCNVDLILRFYYWINHG